MRRFHVPGNVPENSSGLAKTEKRKLILLTVAAFFVVIVLAISSIKSKSLAEKVGDDVPTEAMTESVAVPTLDTTRLEAMVDDDDEEARVILEAEALAFMLEHVRSFTDRHFEALETRPLDAEQLAEIRSDPGAFRGRPYRVRGWIDAITPRAYGGKEEGLYLGRLKLEDGAHVYFAVSQVPLLPSADSFLSIDGLFLKNFNDESDESGEWIDAPLIVGPRAVRSFPAPGMIEELDANLLATLQDDEIFTQTGEQAAWTGLPFDALWHTMAYTRDLPDDAIDWEAAPELDYETLSRLRADGSSYRGQPFRLPISRLQGVRVRRPGENPARIDEYTAGWIGNVTWKSVVHFQTPQALPELEVKDYVTARGFFLKNFAYQSANRGAQIAPVFVLDSIERFDPPSHPIFARFSWVIAGTSLFLVCFITYLLKRDSNKARRLQDDLLRRKRERRMRRTQTFPDGEPADA